MVANGTNFRLHMYNPDQIGGIPVMHEVEPESSLYNCWLFPFKKVLRDTKINQLTFFVEAAPEPFEAATVECKVALYRNIGHLNQGGAVSRIVAEKVTNSEVTTGTSGLPILQMQWTFPTDLELQGGSYWIVVAIQTVSGRDPAFGTYTFMGIMDADSNIEYPKYEVELASPLTLPSTINVLKMAREVTQWFYASGEWY